MAVDASNRSFTVPWNGLISSPCESYVQALYPHTFHSPSARSTVHLMPSRCNLFQAFLRREARPFHAERREAAASSMHGHVRCGANPFAVEAGLPWCLGFLPAPSPGCVLPHTGSLWFPDQADPRRGLCCIRAHGPIWASAHAFHICFYHSSQSRLLFVPSTQPASLSFQARAQMSRGSN